MSLILLGVATPISRMSATPTSNGLGVAERHPFYAVQASAAAPARTRAASWPRR